MHFDENMETYVEKTGHKVELMVCTFALVISLLLDQLYGQEIFDQSSKLTVYLQQTNLVDLSMFCSYVLFFLLFLYPFICYVIRNHIEVSLILLFQVFALMYFEVLLKLIYTDTKWDIWSLFGGVFLICSGMICLKLDIILLES